MESVKKVFSEEFQLLRELIFDYALRESVTPMEDDVDRTTLCSIRLVQKSWLLTVNKMFKLSKTPLFMLNLNEMNSCNESPFVQKSGKLLENFSKSTFICEPRFQPLFSLNLEPEFFRLQNAKSLRDIFISRGHELATLEMWYPRNCGSMHSYFPKFSLPNLRILSVRFLPYMIDLDDGELIVKQGDNATRFAQSVLWAAEGLTIFCIDDGGLPANSEHLYLPSTIAHLYLICMITNIHLDLIIESSFANLSTLRLNLEKILPSGDEPLFRVLNKYKSTLKNLQIPPNFGPTMKTHVIKRLRFPVMEKLESLSIRINHCQLEPNLFQLENLLPKLGSFELESHTGVLFKMWTLNSKFESVHTLELALLSGTQRRDESHGAFSWDLESMQGLHMAFPCVRKLSLTLAVEKTCGLEYMFTELTELTHLTLRIKFNEAPPNSDFFDALFIGVPVECIAEIRANPDWEEIRETPSIRGLKRLKSLELYDVNRKSKKVADSSSLISDLIFKFALLKMPNLNELLLTGLFKISDDMNNIWTAQNRKISYDPEIYSC